MNKKLKMPTIQQLAINKILSKTKKSISQRTAKSKKNLEKLDKMNKSKNQNSKKKKLTYKQMKSRTGL